MGIWFLYLNEKLINRQKYNAEKCLPISLPNMFRGAACVLPAVRKLKSDTNVLNGFRRMYTAFLYSISTFWGHCLFFILPASSSIWCVLTSHTVLEEGQRVCPLNVSCTAAIAVPLYKLPVWTPEIEQGLHFPSVWKLRYSNRNTAFSTCFWPK